MRMRILLVVVCLASACSLPSRDNPFDPANAPAAQLVVRRLAGPGSPCPPLVVNSSAEAVGSASRGDCLELDAGASDDPHGEPMRFRFAFLDGATRVPLGPEGPASTLLLDRSLVFGLSSAGQATFSVTVTDSHGFGETKAVLALLDGRPDAGRQAMRALPLGGYPWAPGAPIAVAFRPVGVSDPDADAPLYCWQFPASLTNPSCSIAPGPYGICSSAPDDPCFTRSLDPSSAGRVTAVLQVRDGTRATDRTSLPVPATIDVRKPNLWAGPGGNIPGTRIERLDADQFRIASFQNYPHVDFDPAQNLMAVLDRPVNDYQLTMAAWPSAAVLAAPVSFPTGNQAGVRVDPAAHRLWVHENDLPPGAGMPASGAVHAWTIGNGGSLTPTVDLSVSVPYTGSQSEVSIEIPSTGSAWIGRFGGFSQIRIVRPDGATATIDAGTDRLFQSLAARPGTSQVWAVRTMSAVTGTGSPFEPAKLVAFDEATQQQTVYDLSLGGAPVDFATGLAWIDGSEAWLAVSTIGLLHVDVPTLEATGRLDDAVLGIVDVPNVAGRMIVDPATGSVWATSASAGVLRATRSGTIAFYSGANRPDRIDPSGRLWSTAFLPDPTLTAGESPARSGVVETADVLLSLFPEPDLMDGGLWATSIAPASLQHLSEDMTDLQTFTSFRLDGGSPVAMPIMLPARFEPATRTAWAIGRGGNVTVAIGLYRIDFSTDPPSATTVLDATRASDLAILEASAPLPGSTPFAWGLTRSGGQVVTITPGGGETPVFTLPSTERYFGAVRAKAARSMATNRLCLGTLDDSSGTNVLHVRRFDPSGAVETLANVTLTANFDFAAIAAASGSGEDACLAAYEDLADGNYANMTSTVAVWLDATKALPTAVLTGGQFSSLVAVSPERFWVSLLRPAPGDTAPSVYNRRFSWNGSSYDEAELDAAAFTVLVAPDAQNRLLP